LIKVSNDSASHFLIKRKQNFEAPRSTKGFDCYAKAML